MEGWIIKYRVENLSSRPIYLLGFGLWSDEDDRTQDPQHFFVFVYRQTRKFGAAKWPVNDEALAQIKNKSYLRGDKLVIQRLGYYEWASPEGWNFDIPHVNRFKTFIGFQDQKEPCVITSDSFILQKLDYSNSAKIVFVKD